MADTSLGFRYRYRLYGGDPTIQKFLVKDTETQTKGDMVLINTGEIDIGATDSKALVGVVNQTIAGTDSTTYVEVISDPDAVYAVYDASARLYGAHLDIAGTTGAMTVASDTNHDLIVVAASTAAEETLVMITHGAHVLNVTVT